MMFRRIGLSMIVLSCTMIGTSRLRADDAKSPSTGTHNCILDAMAAKLGLSAAQKEQIRKIHSECEQKSENLEHQCWTLHHEAREALSKMLTNEQRTALPGALKAEKDRLLKDVATKLGLNDEQRQRVEKIRANYAQKFHQMASQKDANDQGQKFHQLRRQEFEAMCMELTNEQRTRLPAILKQEFRNWMSPSAKADIRKDIADKLNLNAEQRKQCEKICSGFEPQSEKLHAQLRKLWKDEHAAVRQVLDEKQRAQFDQLMGHNEKGAKERR